METFYLSGARLPGEGQRTNVQSVWRNATIDAKTLTRLKGENIQYSVLLISIITIQHEIETVRMSLCIKSLCNITIIHMLIQFTFTIGFLYFKL